MATLTDEMVANFIENKLKISDWKSKLEKNKFEFLKEFLQTHGVEIYFQNVTWSIPKSERTLPTIEKTIKNGMENSGGVCIHLNYFVYLILAHLGYDTFIAAADYPPWPTPRSHLMTIVRLPSGDDQPPHLWLIELGFCGQPALDLVPLHSLPYKGRIGGFPYEFRFNPESQFYERIIYEGNPITGKFEPGRDSQMSLLFDLTPVTYDDFPDLFQTIFTPEAVNPFLESLLLYRLTSVDGPNGDFEYVCCRSTILYEGTRDTFKETHFESYQQMLPFINKYFPKLDPHQLHQAILHYNTAKRPKGTGI